MKLKILATSVIILSSCSSYEVDMINKGNIIIERIESYRDSVGSIPMSLWEVDINAINKENDELFYYQAKTTVDYTLSFSNGVGESKIYYSDSKQWEDFPREINN